MEEAPGLAGCGVIAFVELVHQFVTGLALYLLVAAKEQNGRSAVWLLVYLVDCAVKYGQCVYLR